MRITPLGSGSQGNSLLVRCGDEQILIDAGFPIEELEARLAATGTSAPSITAICMTHRHHDHKRGVADFCRAHGTRVFGTRRTVRSLCNKLAKHLHMIKPGRSFRIGHVDITPVELAHDAPQTVGYVFDDGEHRFGYATDLGCDDGQVGDVFMELDALLLEFNYDSEMLANGPYHPQLRSRIASDRGHLSNDQAATLLGALDHSRLKHVWIGHVSRRNNRSELALAAATTALGPDYVGGLSIALQDEVSATLDLVSSARCRVSGPGA